MEYYSVIKRNKLELVVLRWMSLETVIQSEVRKRKTNAIHTHTHTHIYIYIYGIQKNRTEELIYIKQMERQM